jgi:VanZ family protein
VGGGVLRGRWLWDEWRQLSLPGRSAGWDDLLFDAMGIAVGVMLAGWLGRRVVSVAGVDQRH